MFESLEKIPKGVNVIVFIWALFGLFMVLRNPKIRKEKSFYIFSGIIGFMMVWRVGVGIMTSRYATGLILPFVVFASYFLCHAGKKKHALVRAAFYVMIACTGFILLKMNTDSVFRNYSSDIVSEVFKRYDRTNNLYSFRAPWKDFSRILFASHLNERLVAVYDTHFHKFIFEDKSVYPRETLINIDSRMIADDAEVWDKLRTKQVASLVEDAEKNKRQLIFLLSSDDQCIPVPENRIPPYRPNLLDNGDLEELDSPEESCDKLKAHNAECVLSNASGETVLTPRNAFFSAEPAAASLFEVNAQNDSRIAGNNSARIRFNQEKEYRRDIVWDYFPDKVASLMFDRHFSNGDYEFSMLVRGETGAEVCVVCEFCKDGSREPRRIAAFRIPDKRLFQITTHFSVDDLGQDDYFQVGVSVQKGEAYFDNFSLTPAVSAPAASSAD